MQLLREALLRCLIKPHNLHIAPQTVKQEVNFRDIRIGGSIFLEINSVMKT
jgi:hypothetical protein